MSFIDDGDFFFNTVADEHILSSVTSVPVAALKSNPEFHHQHRHRMHHLLQWHAVPFPAQDSIRHVLSCQIVDDGPPRIGR